MINIENIKSKITKSLETQYIFIKRELCFTWKLDNLCNIRTCYLYDFCQTEISPAKQESPI